MTPRLAVVGAIALDEIETPKGSARDLLGGSCSYVALAASLLGAVEIISIVGDDLPGSTLDPLRERGVGLGSARREAGSTFRWGCRYRDDWEIRDTLYTRTGVFSEHPIAVQDAARAATHLLLTAGQTDQNRRALDVCRERTLTMLDSIEREVADERETLLAMLPEVDILTLNAYETGILSGQPQADVGTQQRTLAEYGAGTLLCKQGAAGVEIHAAAGGSVRVPAVPWIEVVDPTGAGDSFGGAVLSALALGASLTDAARWGCAVASFTVEDFGLAGLLRATLDGVRDRASQIGLSDTSWLRGVEDGTIQNGAAV